VTCLTWWNRKEIISLFKQQSDYEKKMALTLWNNQQAWKNGHSKKNLNSEMKKWWHAILTWANPRNQWLEQWIQQQWVNLLENLRLCFSFPYSLLD
jgi:hypothetical protein